MMKSKHCLFIMPVLFCGGSEKQIRLLIHGVSKRNGALTVLVEASSAEAWENENAFISQHSNVSFILLRASSISLKYRNVFVRYFAKIIALVRMSILLFREIRERKINLVMVTNLTGLVLLPLLKLLNCEVVYNERNPGINVTNTFWKKFLLKRCDMLFCNSKSASKVMEKRLNRSVEIMNNGIVQKKYEPRTLGKKCLKILVPARISRVKNQMVVLKAAEHLRSTYGFYCSLFFAGVVEDDSYKSELDTFIIQKNLTSCVNFLGFVPDMSELYRTSDLAILASYEEGTPNVLLESFMCGINVLASNISMNADCMRNDDLLFDVDDSDLLAKKILWLNSLSADKLLEYLDENRRFVMENYGEEQMIDRYMARLYDSSLK